MVTRITATPIMVIRTWDTMVGREDGAGEGVAGMAGEASVFAEGSAGCMAASVASMAGSAEASVGPTVVAASMAAVDTANRCRRGYGVIAI